MFEPVHIFHPFVFSDRLWPSDLNAQFTHGSNRIKSSFSVLRLVVQQCTANQ